MNFTPTEPPVQAAPSVSVQEWADRINLPWQAAVQNFIEVGRRLLAAKASLPHGQWHRLFKGQANGILQPLRFSRQTAFRLMTIAANPVLTNVTYMQLLPPSWGTLYELSQLAKPILEELLLNGAIHPDMHQLEARALRERHDRSSGYGNSGLATDIAYGRETDRDILLRYMEETNALLRAPLQLSEDANKIVAGVYWLPDVPAPAARPKPAPKPQHSCPVCGDVHCDRQ